VLVEPKKGQTWSKEGSDMEQRRKAGIPLDGCAGEPSTSAAAYELCFVRHVLG